MDFLGIGPLELVMIFVLALIIIGPREMVRVGRTIGEFIRKMTSSDAWRAVQRASREMRSLPGRIARESGLQDIQRDLAGSGPPPKPVSNRPAEPAGAGQPAPEVNLEGWTQKPAEPPGKPTPGAEKES